MDDTTSLLFGLDSFRVVDVVRVADRMVQVVIETVERQGICPDCRTASTRVKDRALVRIRDLPAAISRSRCGGASGGWPAWSRRVLVGRSHRPRPRSRRGRG
jgi:hypothetical protein